MLHWNEKGVLLLSALLGVVAIFGIVYHMPSHHWNKK
jgi:hypothetical protein